MSADQRSRRIYVTTYSTWSRRTFRSASGRKLFGTSRWSCHQRLRDTSRIVSRENVELVRKLFEVYNERSFAENVELLDPEIVWDLSRVELPDGDSYTGLSELRSFVEAWEEGFESDHVSAQEIVDGGDRVV